MESVRRLFLALSINPGHGKQSVTSPETFLGRSALFACQAPHLTPCSVRAAGADSLCRKAALIAIAIENRDNGG